MNYPHPTPDERSPAWTSLLCAVLLSATFINYADRVVVTQNAVPILKEFEASEEEYGKINGRFGLGFAFGAVVFGILADLLPVRWLYPAVVLAWSTFGAVSGNAKTLDELIQYQTLLGFFEAGHWPCALRTTQRVFRPEKRTLGNSLLQSGAALGAVVTPLVILAIHQRAPEHWRVSFYLAGALGIPWAVGWLLLVRDSDLARPVIQTDDSPTGRGFATPASDPPFLHVFLMRRWWVLLAIVLFINTVWHYIRVWMPVILEKDRHYSHEFVQGYTSLYNAATFLGSLASGGLTAWLVRQNWHVHRARLAAFLLFAVLTALCAVAAFLPNGSLLLGTLLLVAFGSLGLFPVYYSLNQEISAKHQGKVGGVLGFTAWMVMSYVHPAVGKAVDTNPGIRPWIFATVGLLPLAGWIVLALFWGRRGESNRIAEG